MTTPIDELRVLRSLLASSRAEDHERRVQRDSLILDAKRAGFSAREIAKAAGLAPVTVYALLDGRETAHTRPRKVLDATDSR